MKTNLSVLGNTIIDGEEFISQPDGKNQDEVVSMNPFSGEVLWRCAPSDDSSIDKAIDAARRAFPGWARLTVDQRCKSISAFVELVKRDAEELTQLIASEAGKPIWESKVEVNSLVTKLTASVDAYKSRAAESSREVRGLLSRTRFKPHGVMAVLGPFNFPASMANSHIMPSLLAGNTVVFKPSELTPVVGLVVSRLWQEAGLPPGVLNCVSGGQRVGERLVNDPRINGVLFVGSHRAGMAILRTLIEHPEKIVAVEMGGNSPLVIWDYDDIDPVISIIIQSAYMSGGQRCSAARRLIINETDTKLVPRLVEVLSKLRVGDFNLTPEPYYGPIIRPAAAQRVLERVDELKAHGAVDLLPLKKEGPIGTLLRPGLLDVERCTDDRDEEIFGPVLKLRRASTLSDAVTMANDTKFGLASGIVCKNREMFEEFFMQANAGIVNWNQQLTGATTFAPFGGIKQSGNFRPAGFMSADYCSYSIASFEVASPKLPDAPVPGIIF